MPTALARGFVNRCPVCAGSPVFRGWLSVEPVCPVCATPLGEVRADDAPPYFVIFITGHLVIGLMIWLEQAYSPPLWVHAAIFIPMTIALALGLLRPVKGATVGLMLKLGFVRSPSDSED